MKKKKIPDPDKPLTSAEFSSMKKHYGIEGLPEAIRKTIGRPKVDNPKQPISFRFDSDIVEHLKHDVSKYNSRVEGILRAAMSEGRL